MIWLRLVVCFFIAYFIGGIVVSMKTDAEAVIFVVGGFIFSVLFLWEKIREWTA